MNACALVQRYAPLAGRVLLGLLFVQSGLDKIVNFDKVVVVMGRLGVPAPELLLVLSIVIVLPGGLMLAAGWRAQWAAFVLFLWMIPITLVFHPFWAAEPAQFLNQLHHFLKNLAIAGALLVIAGVGAGPLSFDARRTALQPS